MEFKLTVVIAVVNLCNLLTEINTENAIFENITSPNELVSSIENVTKMPANEFTEVEIDHALTHDALRRKPKTNSRRPKTLFQSPKLDYTIWPKPNSVSMTHKYMLINSASFKMIPSSDCLIINTAITRYREKMFIQDCSRLDYSFRGKHLFYQNQPPLNRRAAENVGQLRALHLSWRGHCERDPQMNMNEAYQISVDAERGAEIKAQSIWGILRGLETFSQLLENVAYNEFKVNLVKISDGPRFAHRQLMIDTSRHFLSVRSILKTLDAMEMNKLNVLHWHVVDDQSFPFVSESYPQLARNGSWSPAHVYTVQDVEKIIDHARLRGIRILAEFDTPGHTLSWGKGIPSLLTQCFENGKPNGQLGPFDPTKKSTYDFLQVFYSEIARRFPDLYMHIGGDEVNTKCWASNPKIKQFMQQHNFKKLSQLEAYYIQRLVDLVGGRLKRSYIVWQDVFDEGVHLAPDTLVHVWIEKRNGGWRWKMDQVTKAGYQTILSAPWYLETAYTEAWREYYETDLLDWDGSEEQKRRVLGGGACIWGEYADGGNLMQKVWTTTAAVAEKLWSPKEATKEAAKAVRRFHAQHCRMQIAGLRIGPQEGPGYCPCDFAVY